MVHQSRLNSGHNTQWAAWRRGGGAVSNCTVGRRTTLPCHRATTPTKLPGGLFYELQFVKTWKTGTYCNPLRHGSLKEVQRHAFLIINQSHGKGCNHIPHGERATRACMSSFCSTNLELSSSSCGPKKWKRRRRKEGRQIGAGKGWGKEESLRTESK